MGVMNCPWRHMNAPSTMTKIEKYQILEASIRKYDFSEDGAAELQAVEAEDVVERALDSGSFETKSDEV
jgi:hypothetical protein